VEAQATRFRARREWAPASHSNARRARFGRVERTTRRTESRAWQTLTCPWTTRASRSEISKTSGGGDIPALDPLGMPACLWALSSAGDPARLCDAGRRSPALPLAPPLGPCLRISVCATPAHVGAASNLRLTRRGRYSIAPLTLGGSPGGACTGGNETGRARARACRRACSRG
jgi:hypothetical protein